MLIKYTSSIPRPIENLAVFNNLSCVLKYNNPNETSMSLAAWAV